MRKRSKNMTPVVVGIAGVGLMGGSVALRLRKAGFASTIVGCDHRAVMKRGRARGILDKKVDSVVELLRECAVIILAAPLRANERLLIKLAQKETSAKPLILDLGSLQSPIAGVARRASWKNKAQFVACHPMAGKETSGIDCADPNLFEGCAMFVDSSAALSRRNSAVLKSLIYALGAHPVRIPNIEHDKAMAIVSQLPQIISTVYAGMFDRRFQQYAPLAGQGARGVGRLGGSSYLVWKDIISPARDELASTMNVFIQGMQAVSVKLTKGKNLRVEFTRGQRGYRCLL